MSEARDAPAATRTSAAGCLAPALQLVLLPNGDVGPCCRNSKAYGNIRYQRLSDIWFGKSRVEMAAETGVGRLPNSCGACAAELEIMSRSASYPAQFDFWADRLDVGRETQWPLRIEFDLSNVCNLQCQQCHGDLSSSIRIHRERRPALPKVYGDEFFEDLAQFLPHLRSAGFAGGEPFMAAETHRVWDLLAEVSPGLECTIVTNGTQWNKRVESVLERFCVQPVISLDGLTRGTYESIRVGADHAAVMANLDRFVAYADRVGTTVNLNFCLMPQNVHEFPDLLIFAEERGIYVNALIVLNPVANSLAQVPGPVLVETMAMMANRAPEMQRRLKINAEPWASTVERMASWLNDDPNAPNTAWSNRIPMILQFDRQGVGPVDDVDIRTELRAKASDGMVRTVSIGQDQRARGWTQELAEALGFTVGELEGEPITVFTGKAEVHQVVADGGDRYEARFDMPGRDVAVVMAPIRDEHGWADEVRVHFAIRPR